MRSDIEAAVCAVFKSHGFGVNGKIGGIKYTSENAGFKIDINLDDALSLEEKNYNIFASQNGLVSTGQYVAVQSGKNQIFVTPRGLTRGAVKVKVEDANGKIYLMKTAMFSNIGKKEMAVTRVINAKDAEKSAIQKENLKEAIEKCASASDENSSTVQQTAVLDF